MESYTSKYVAPLMPTRQQMLEDLQVIFESAEEPKCDLSKRDYNTFLYCRNKLEQHSKRFAEQEASLDSLDREIAAKLAEMKELMKT